MKKGDNALFTCLSKVPPVWSFNNNRIPTNARITTAGRLNTLNIANIEISNRGYYECEGRTTDEDIFFAQGVLKLISKLF